MFRVKICGITNWPDARRAIEAGCDAIGFNFFPRSPRYIAPQDAALIRRRMPREIAAVGVFVDLSPAVVAQMAHTVPLDFAQLHGDERPAAARTVGRSVPVIKAFRVGPRFRAERVARFPAAAFLLDGAPPNGRLRGGAGRAFDWSFALAASQFGPIVLAGGLTPENVAQAIRIAHPSAVDVASGVERSPGRKDPRKLRAFLDAVDSAREDFA
ncbi:MAG TPA: phosphoribosylanthranilate isomerase [Candidatus Acidoferrales bacterium]|nr:phosphoribosylanthranilate isomerase [Candidatus Acidoferrales bacterium]